MVPDFWSSTWVFGNTLWSLYHFWIFYCKIGRQGYLSSYLQLCLSSISRRFGFHPITDGVRNDSWKKRLEGPRKIGRFRNGWARSPPLRPLEERLLVRLPTYHWRHQKTSSRSKRHCSPSHFRCRRGYGVGLEKPWKRVYIGRWYGLQNVPWYPIGVYQSSEGVLHRLEPSKEPQEWAYWQKLRPRRPMAVQKYPYPQMMKDYYTNECKFHSFIASDYC